MPARKKTLNEKFETSTYLNNPRLRGPNTPHEWSDEQLEEWTKCKNDVMYFVKKYITIVTLDHGEQLFDPYPYQEKMIKRFQHYRNNVAVLPRQSGKSTVVAAFICHYILFQRSKSVAILAHKAGTAREILSRIKLAYELIPKWMQQGVVEWNKGTIALENGSSVAAGATTSGSIRGYTCNLLFMDEVAHIPTNLYKEFFRSVYPTISSGKTSQIIMVSTPNGMNHFYDIVKRAQKNAIDPSQKGNRNRFRLTAATWRDVPGRDEKWKEDEIANTSVEDFAQEQECKFLGASNTLLEPTDLAHLLENVEDVVPIAYKFNQQMKVFDKPVPGHKYFISVDPAEGVGQDYTVVNVFDIDRLPFEQVAVFKSNKTSEILMAPIINTIAKFYNDAFILGENNKGQVILHSLNFEFEYENLIKVKMKGRARSEFGITMNKLVKRLGCSRLKDMIEERKLVLKDKDTVREFFTFTATGNSYSAEEGYHDDLVMTCVLFAYFVNTTEFGFLGEELESFRDHLIDKHNQDIVSELPVEPVVDTGEGRASAIIERSRYNDVTDYDSLWDNDYVIDGSKELF